MSGQKQQMIPDTDLHPELQMLHIYRESLTGRSQTMCLMNVLEKWITLRDCKKNTITHPLRVYFDYATVNIAYCNNVLMF